jgi:hypothetical protein
MFRPHFAAFLTDAKLSSSKTMSEWAWATALPETPIAKPTLASLKQRESLILSPVYAQLEPDFFIAATNMCLTSGQAR